VCAHCGDGSERVACGHTAFIPQFDLIPIRHAPLGWQGPLETKQT
jgi:hypothetical protein